jgi:hypothetical protein
MFAINRMTLEYFQKGLFQTGSTPYFAPLLFLHHRPGDEQNSTSANDP